MSIESQTFRKQMATAWSVPALLFVVLPSTVMLFAAPSVLDGLKGMLLSISALLAPAFGVGLALAPWAGRRVPTTTTVTVSSYPFTVLEETPGEEPLTILEKQKLKSNGPRMRFAAMFGYWPRPADLRRAIEKGLIKVQDEETISSVSSQMIEEPEETEE